MKRTLLQRVILALGAIIGALGMAIVPAAAVARTGDAPTAKTGDSAATTRNSAGDQAKLQLIITRGNNEIARRLTTLNTLSSKLSGSTKLTDSDKASLNAEINDEISGLNSLKTKLDADTTVSDAKADAQSIVKDYRVYALIIPKVNLLRTADEQQVAESKLAELASKLQIRITAAKTAGKNVTSLQNSLSTMNGQISAAQTISSTIESNVIGLQPSNYDTNHRVLGGDRDQLKTAQSDIKSALNTAGTIINGLKTL